MWRIPQIGRVRVRCICVVGQVHAAVGARAVARIKAIGIRRVMWVVGLVLLSGGGRGLGVAVAVGVGVAVGVRIVVRLMLAKVERRRVLVAWVDVRAQAGLGSLLERRCRRVGACKGVFWARANEACSRVLLVANDTCRQVCCAKARAQGEALVCGGV